MNGYGFTLAGARLVALPCGALWWEERALLAVSDLHLGKADRVARRTGRLLPPYETEDTLARLDAAIAAARPATVVCLGDSFDDDLSAGALAEAHLLWLARLMAGRRWVWVAGNHDPGPVGLGGTHLSQLREGPLVFRHVAEPDASGEVSGHYHPKAGLGAGAARPCFLLDAARLILPAFGTYTGGLASTAEPLAGLMLPGALALLVGARVVAAPMPRGQPVRKRSTASR